jgi:hypothetical protein
MQLLQPIENMSHNQQKSATSFFPAWPFRVLGFAKTGCRSHRNARASAAATDENLRAFPRATHAHAAFLRRVSRERFEA